MTDAKDLAPSAGDTPPSRLSFGVQAHPSYDRFIGPPYAPTTSPAGANAAGLASAETAPAHGEGLSRLAERARRAIADARAGTITAATALDVIESEIAWAEHPVGGPDAVAR